jgi:hypothetical protein
MFTQNQIKIQKDRSAVAVEGGIVLVQFSIYNRNSDRYCLQIPMSHKLKMA